MCNNELIKLAQLNLNILRNQLVFSLTKVYCLLVGYALLLKNQPPVVNL